MTAELARCPVEDRLRHIADHVRQDNEVNDHRLPGLASLLDDELNPDVDVSHEDFLRRLLRVFKDSKTDATFSSILSKYDPEESNRVHSFVNGSSIAHTGHNFEIGISLAAREEFQRTSSALQRVESAAEDLFLRAEAAVKRTVELEIFDDEAHKRHVRVFRDEPFQNWGQTVQNVPQYTCVPRTAHGVQNIVKYAKTHDMNVRASGYRHSWAPIFSQNGQILVSMLDLHVASKLPNLLSLPDSDLFDRPTDLTSINFVGEPRINRQRLVRVGCAATNQQLRRWCIEQKIEYQSALPLNVIMVEITLGGSNAPICHGAGRRHPSLSDLVQSIEYVDVNGVLQTIDSSQPKFLSVASGCFGLLGIVTHITLILDPMSYAVMQPRKLPAMIAIPPPPEMSAEDIPAALRTTMTSEQRTVAQADFEKHLLDDFYSEWFWFPYTSEVWVNCWNTMDDPLGAVNYPSDPEVFLQFVQTVAIQILQNAELDVGAEKLVPLLQTTLVSKLGLDAMIDIPDPQKAIKTQLPNGLHFRRAIQNVRVRDMEIEIPLQPIPSPVKDPASSRPAIDFSIVQRAWWNAILTAYRYTSTCPQRMPLELRVTGTSNVVMAPYRHNDLGTCSIEILTLDSEKESWHPYAQVVLDSWMGLKDSQGNYLRSRPHWAKEWVPFKVRGQGMLEYVKSDEIYGKEILEFVEILENIGKTQGWGMAELRRRFGNEMLDALFFNEHQDSEAESTTADARTTSAGGIVPDNGSQGRLDKNSPPNGQGMRVNGAAVTEDGAATTAEVSGKHASDVSPPSSPSSSSATTKQEGDSAAHHPFWNHLEKKVESLLR